MAFNDTLFQLGMDLTRSSTTQTEDLVAHASPAEASVRSGGRDIGSDEQFAGTHLIIDLFGAKRLDDAAHVEQAIRSAAYVAGRDVLSLHLHRHAEGLMGFAALDGGHVTLNAYAKAGYAAFDILVSGDAKAHLTVDVLKDAFDATGVVLKGHQRGAETGLRGWNIEAPRQEPVRRLQKTPRLVRTKRVA
jgi:S-adenosylmethionine decarboxylase